MSKRFTVRVEDYTTDNRGNRTLRDEWDVEGCYAYPMTSTETEEFNEVPATGATLVGPTNARIPSTARVKIPAGHPQAGTWQVEGDYGGIESPLTGWRPGGTVRIKWVGP